MNNREWLYSLDVADLSDWFDAEHVETEERAYGKCGMVGGSFCDTPEQGEVVMPLESWREYLDTASENEDSRELLEADVLHHVEDIRNKSGWTGVCANYGTVIEWLDRQAAITEREYGERMASEAMCSNVCAVVCEQRGRIAELQAQLYELTAERVKLRSQICKLEDDLVRTSDERDNWKANCEDWTKFGKCIDYADAINALMDDEGMA